MHYEAATVREWTDLVRRARLGRTTKAVALMLATYADGDGSRIRPGLARLSVETELSYNVVKASLAALRAAGLIHLIKPAQQTGKADEYRLTIGDLTIEKVDVWTPARILLEIERTRESKQGRYNPRHLRPTAQAADPVPEADLQPTGKAAEPVDKSDLQPTARAAETPLKIQPAAHGVGPKTRPAAHGVVDLQPTAWAPTHHDLDTSTTIQLPRDIHTDVAVIAREGPEPEVPEERSTPAIGRAAVPRKVLPFRPRTA